MKLEYTTGCTCDSLTVNGKETVDMTPQELQEIIKKSIHRVTDIGSLQSILGTIICNGDNGDYTDLGYCGQCGDSIDKFTLEIADDEQ